MSNQRIQGPPAGVRLFRATFRVRSYELDSFGHLNHAVYFNYFEQARFDALAEGGFPGKTLAERGWGIHLAHAEADYLAEAVLGDRIVVLTWVSSARRSSMTLDHVAHAEDDERHVYATGRVVSVWIGSDRRPMRMPVEAAHALGIAPAR